jgi:hypothetical protein
MDDPMDQDEDDSGQDPGKPVIVKTEDEMQDSSSTKASVLLKPGTGGAALAAGSVKRLGSVRDGGPDLSMVRQSAHFRSEFLFVLPKMPELQGFPWRVIAGVG